MPRLMTPPEARAAALAGELLTAQRQAEEQLAASTAALARARRFVAASALMTEGIRMLRASYVDLLAVGAQLQREHDAAATANRTRPTRQRGCKKDGAKHAQR